MTDDQQLTLWLGATRYYLGRRTYAVADFCGMLRRQWAFLPEATRKIIERDVGEAFQLDDEMRRWGPERDASRWRPLGDDCDRKQWERVRALWLPTAAPHTASTIIKER